MQAGGGGNENVVYYQNWKLIQQKLCATIHLYMDRFFESITEFGDYEDGLSQITPLDLSDLEESKGYQQIAHRIVNSVIYLEEILL